MKSFILVLMAMAASWVSCLQIHADDRPAFHGMLIFGKLTPDDNFVLSDEVLNLKSFSGTLYRGHFERGGVPIASGVSVQIKKVVYFRHFDPQASKPQNLTYLIFGHPGEYFMAHWIVSKPDFDQLAEVQLNAARPFVQLSGQPYCFTQVEDLSDDKPLENASVGLQLSSPCENATVSLRSFKEIYLEFGDLSD